MNDLHDDLDDMLAAAAADYRHSTLPLITPAGSGAARVTLRRRRQLRAVTVSCLAVLVIVPAVFYAAKARTGPDPTGPANVPSVDPGKQVRAPWWGSVPFTAPPGKSSEPVRSRSQQPVSQLDNAVLSLPKWSERECSSVHYYQFVDGSSGNERLVAAVMHDVDRDGSADWVTQVACLSTGEQQVVVFAAQPGSDRFRTIGQVVKVDARLRPGGVGAIDGVSIVGTEIRVRVGDYGDSVPGGAARLVQWQVRGYAYRDGAFGQVSGPTSFPVNPAAIDLSVAAAPPTLGPVIDDWRTATVPLTVTNHGQRPVTQWTVDIRVPFGSALDHRLGRDPTDILDQYRFDSSPTDCTTSMSKFGILYRIKCTLTGRIEPGGSITENVTVQIFANMKASDWHDGAVRVLPVRLDSAAEPAVGDPLQTNNIAEFQAPRLKALTP